MGIIISLLLIAVGAILAFAVNSSGGSIDVDAVGIILMVVGFILFLISLVFWRTWWGVGMWAGPGYVEEGPASRRYWPARRRRTYVEDEGPPPGPPY
jgi:hypothetical protein